MYVLEKFKSHHHIETPRPKRRASTVHPREINVTPRGCALGHAGRIAVYIDAYHSRGNLRDAFGPITDAARSVENRLVGDKWQAEPISRQMLDVNVIRGMVRCHDVFSDPFSCKFQRHTVFGGDIDIPAASGTLLIKTNIWGEQE